MKTRKLIIKALIISWLAIAAGIDAYLFIYHIQHNNNLIFEPTPWLQGWLLFALFIPMVFWAIAGFLIFWAVVVVGCVIIMFYIIGGFLAAIGYLFIGEFIIPDTFDLCEIQKK